jgi:hypothetical protein
MQTQAMRFQEGAGRRTDVTSRQVSDRMSRQFTGHDAEAFYWTKFQIGGKKMIGLEVLLKENGDNGHGRAPARFTTYSKKATWCLPHENVYDRLPR